MRAYEARRNTLGQLMFDHPFPAEGCAEARSQLGEMTAVAAPWGERYIVEPGERTDGSGNTDTVPGFVLNCTRSAAGHRVEILSWQKNTPQPVLGRFEQRAFELELEVLRAVDAEAARRVETQLNATLARSAGS